MPKLDPYDKKLSYSYALGIFPALKLLENRPECVTRLLLSPDGLGSEGVQKLRDRCAELGIRWRTWFPWQQEVHALRCSERC